MKIKFAVLNVNSFYVCATEFAWDMQAVNCSWRSLRVSRWNEFKHRPAVTLTFKGKVKLLLIVSVSWPSNDFFKRYNSEKKKRSSGCLNVRGSFFFSSSKEFEIEFFSIGAQYYCYYYYFILSITRHGSSVVCGGTAGERTCGNRWR